MLKLAGAEGFLVDAADGLHLAGERDLAGDGDVLTEEASFQWPRGWRR